jgi:hypothetical protein
MTRLRITDRAPTENYKNLYYFSSGKSAFFPCNFLIHSNCNAQKGPQKHSTFQRIQYSLAQKRVSILYVYMSIQYETQKIYA